MFGLAQNGDAPQSCVVLSRSRVPARAILIASLFSYGALAASVLAPDRVFNFLVTSSGAIMLFIYLIIAFAQLRLRARFEAEDPSALQIRMWLYPYGTWAAMAGMAGVLLLMGLSDVHASELWASVLVATGFLVAYAVKRRAQA
jgi:L-asparagine transporter-like permease